MNNQINKTKVDIQRTQLAVIGMNNVSVTDTSVNKLNNDYGDYVNNLYSNGMNSPLFGRAIQANAATAENVLAIPSSGLTTNDKVVIVATGDTGRPKEVKDVCSGLIIAENYMNFKQGRTHSVQIIPFFGDGTKDSLNVRNLVVEPVAGVNSISEYVVLPTLRPMTLGYSSETSFNAGTLPIPASGQKSAGNYFCPWPLSTFNDETQKESYGFIAVIFKGAANESVDISVTPLFGGIIAARMIAEIINA